MAFDAIVIGAGPAGLTAAIYLARFKRRFLVLHDDASRAAWIPLTRNHPGFPGGVSGNDLLERMRRQAESFGAEIRSGRVETLHAHAGGFGLTVGGEVLSARTVLLATGVVDNAPNIAGVEDAVRQAVVRICPICDGFEIEGRPVAVISDRDPGAREALFLTTYSDAVTLVHLGAPAALPPAERRALRAGGVTVFEAGIGDLSLEKGAVHVAGLGSFEIAYSALGVRPRVELALQAGATLAEDGRLIVDDHQQTSVPGLFAAGDMVRGLNQISTAEAEAAIAATAIHNRLRQGGS